MRSRRPGQLPWPGAGEILYIPKFWWHYVRSTTFAVNLNLWACTPREQLWQQDVSASVP